MDDSTRLRREEAGGSYMLEGRLLERSMEAELLSSVMIATPWEVLL